MEKPFATGAIASEINHIAMDADQHWPDDLLAMRRPRRVPARKTHPVTFPLLSDLGLLAAAQVMPRQTEVKVANKQSRKSGIHSRVAEADKPGTAKSPESLIYHKIHAAITGHRLLPGARLVEDKLSEVFAVSRTRIRSVLHALARDRVVTLQRNRGAVVAYPTVREAKEIFAARRLIEVALARDIVRAADDKALKRLKAHIKKEQSGERSHDRALELKASHEFHTLLAEIVGNRVIIEFLRQLMARSSLITAIYERPDVSSCSHLAHAQLIKYIERRDAPGLAAAMLQHLDKIESDLVLFEREESVMDLKSALEGL